MRKLTIGALGVPVLLFGFVYACGSDDSNTQPTGSSGVGASSGVGGNGGNSSGTAGGIDWDAGSSSGDSGEDACAASTAEATIVMKPVDIIFVIDNSGSMGGEIVQVQNNINVNFASIIEASGIDYRVIMVARHGDDSVESVCIEAPLSTIAAGGCSPPPTQPGNNPPKFFHYSEEIASWNSLCKIIETIDTPDEFSQPSSTEGWGAWLRTDSFKIFVEITDDDVNCTYGSYTFNDSNTEAGGLAVAATFDSVLLNNWPQHFGTESERNYQFYSIVGMVENTPASEPWPPTEPIQTTQCSDGSAGRGTGYQGLSILTGALRWPSCENDSFDAMFNKIAEGVIEGAAVPCEFTMPEPPPGETINPETLVVQYTPGGSGTPVEFEQVLDATDCGPGKFYIESDVITLCPDACDVVTADEDAAIAIQLGCGTPPT